MIHSIILQSGGLFDFENPETSEFTIEDIAHNLGNICRFNGGCDIFFSVAQHSRNVSLLLEGTGDEREGLLHDGQEAFYGDMTTWLKRLCPDYQAREQQGERVVRRRFNLPETMSPAVKRADYLALACERRTLFNNIKLGKGEDGFHHLADISEDEIQAALMIVDMVPMSPRVASRSFLQRWEDVKAR